MTPELVLALALGLLVGYLVFGRGGARTRGERGAREDDLARHLGQLGVDGRERVLAALRRDQKIEAIKEFRDATGAGLKEAKEAVEWLERQRRDGE